MAMKMSEAQRKRVRAGRMLLAGKRPAEVALAVGVARQTVYTWKRVLDEQGIDGLRSMSDGGRPGQLDASSFKWLDTALRQGAQAHGFGTELWTLKRALSSNASSALSTAMCMSGAFWAAWGLAARNPNGVPSSATRKRCAPGGERLGLL